MVEQLEAIANTQASTINLRQGSQMFANFRRFGAYIPILASPYLVDAAVRKDGVGLATAGAVALGGLAASCLAHYMKTQIDAQIANGRE